MRSIHAVRLPTPPLSECRGVCVEIRRTPCKLLAKGLPCRVSPDARLLHRALDAGRWPHRKPSPAAASITTAAQVTAKRDREQTQSTLQIGDLDEHVWHRLLAQFWIIYDTAQRRAREISARGGQRTAHFEVQPPQ